jgi:hypothetical protein
MRCPDVGLVVGVKLSALVSRCHFRLSIFPILALFGWHRRGWRWRKVGYAVGHECFTVTSMPKRGVGTYSLVRTVNLEFAFDALKAGVALIMTKKVATATSTNFGFTSLLLRSISGQRHVNRIQAN